MPDPRKRTIRKARRPATPAPAFPMDVTIPPPRGTLANSTPTMKRTALPRKPRKAKAPMPVAAVATTAAAMPAATGRSRKSGGRNAVAAAPAQPAPFMLAPTALTPATDATSALTCSAASTTTDQTARTVNATGTALVPTGRGLVSRLVAWLGKLAPRKKRQMLPRVRTQIVRPAPVAAAHVENDAALAQRMMLQLSEENARLRAELDALRDRLATTTPA